MNDLHPRDVHCLSTFIYELIFQSFARFSFVNLKFNSTKVTFPAKLKYFSSKLNTPIRISGFATNENAEVSTETGFFNTHLNFFND